VDSCTDVQPLVKVVTYLCDHCGHELYQEVAARQFTPLRQCTSDDCKRNQVKGKVSMQVRGSKFVKYQEVKLQELVGQISPFLLAFICIVHTYINLSYLSM
jgi:DNA replication licensing factor MCM7